MLSRWAYNHGEGRRLNDHYKLVRCTIESLGLPNLQIIVLKEFVALTDILCQIIYYIWRKKESHLQGCIYNPLAPSGGQVQLYNQDCFVEILILNKKLKFTQA